MLWHLIDILFEFRTLFIDIQKKIFEIKRLIFGNLSLICKIQSVIFEIKTVFF